MTSRMTGSRYVLAVKDLKASADFYIGKLGFKRLWAQDGWQFLIRDSVKIMIGKCPDEKSAREIGDHSYFAYLEIENIDNLYHELKSNGLEIISEIENKPWHSVNFQYGPLMGIASRLEKR